MWLTYKLSALIQKLHYSNFYTQSPIFCDSGLTDSFIAGWGPGPSA